MTPKLRSVLFTLFGMVIGMSVIAAYIGGKIGLQQSGAWPAWLAVPLGASMGPFYLVLDLLDILTGHFDRLIALPQSLPGGAIGALFGWLLARLQNRMQKTN